MKKLITYAESKKAKPYDWNKFLNKKKYSRIDLSQASYLAGRWVSCACGYQCEIIPRDENGLPLDGRLMTLGVEFSN